MEIVGIIPAGGIASRLGNIPCSKEILPVLLPGNSNISVISENLIKYYKNAGISKVYFILRKGKWDIPNYFGDGNNAGMNIGYLIMNLPYGTPFTINQAYPFVIEKIVALGFPDIIMKPAEAFSVIRDKLIHSDSDIVLGLFPINKTSKWDMIEFDKNNKIRNIIIKQDRKGLKYGWSIAIWKPSFSEFIKTCLNNFLISHPDGKKVVNKNVFRELYVGDIIQEAILSNMQIDYVKFKNGSCIDIGTPDDLKKFLPE